MTAVQKKLDDIIQKAQDPTQTNIKTIIKDINYINNIPNKQIQTNATAIQQKIQKGFQGVMDSFDRAINNKNQKMLAQFTRSLQNFKQKYRPVLSNSQNNQIKQRIQASAQKLNQIKKQQIKQNRQVKQIQNILNNTQPQKINVTGVVKQNGVNQLQSYKTIQQQVKPFSDLIKAQINSIQPTNLPVSVQMLNQYAVREGYLPMGTISQGKGRSYVGRYSVKSGNSVATFPFPKNTVPTSKTPNIVNNFRYHANKTINAWNQFVKQQNNLVSFVNKVSDPQKRQLYVQQKIKSMNMANFYCQALATLVYYYVQIPLQMFVKFKIQLANDSSFDSFLQNYQVGTQISKNPFLLNNDQAIQIVLLLVNVKDYPFEIFKKVYQLLKKLNNSLNSTRIQQFAEYCPQLRAQAQSYFTNIGLKPSQYKQTLLSQTISGIKKVQFILPSGLQNVQILKIVKKVKQQQKGQKGQKYWNLNWGDQSIMCNDYIWNYQL